MSGLLIEAETKRCPDCGEDKPLTEFYGGRYIATYCKPCSVERSRVSAAKCDGAHGINRGRARWLKRKYNMTPEEWAHRLDEQGGRCALCDVTFMDMKDPRPQVDHDHTTGVIRGLLCLGCNVSIGHFRDDPDLLQKAITYLEDRS